MRLGKYSGVILALASLKANAATVTFRDLAADVLHKSPTLKISRLEVAKQANALTAAKWAVTPNVSIGSARVLRPSDTGGSGIETSTNLSASVNLFDGFASWKDIEIAEVVVSKAESDQLLTKRETLATLASLYLSWQKAHQKFTIVSKLSSMREEALKRIQRTVRIGARPKNDQLLFENLLLQAQERASRTEIEQRQAMIGIQKALSEIAGESAAQLTPQETVVFSKSYCERAATFSNHPKIRSLANQSVLHKAQRQAVGADYYPSIDLSMEKKLDQFSTAATDNQETFRLSFTWSLYTGMSTHFKELELGYEIQKAELKQSEALTELVLTHQANCARLAALDDWYQKANQIARNYEAILATARTQYQNGGISTLDLTDQELRLLDAELSLIDARFAKQEVLASQWILHEANLEVVSK